MDRTPTVVQELVLVGGGHAHALAIRMLAMRPLAGLRITLVSPSSHTPYSGMLPGLLAGHYTFEDTHIDLARLCQWAQIRFIAAQVDGIDPRRRRLSLQGRPPLDYDLLSLDIGAQPSLSSIAGASKHAVPVKPVAGLWQRWQQLCARIDGGQMEAPRRIAVVGGGAGSIELVLAMACRFAGEGVELAMYSAGETLLPGYRRRARQAVDDALSKAGVEVYRGTRVVEVSAAALTLNDGRALPYDEAFWCTEAAPTPWLAQAGLPCDSAGFLAIEDTLQVVGVDTIFAAGDVATQIHNPRPKAGVYAVRQAPVLAHNLRAAALGEPLRSHRPQRRFLSLISLGERRASADRGVFSATGRWVWHWKDHIDRRFMGRFEDLPAMDGRARRALPGLEQEQAHCGGCGAKVGAAGLAQVLADLAQQHPRLCPAGAGAQDVAPIPGSSSATVVQSIDVLRELVSDPWLMGRIAANHALSDLYASGARPLSALASIILPFASAPIQARDLRQLLGGALEEFARVGCPLTGGHSMQGPELAVGFVVNGQLVSGGLGKQGLAVGDKLVLAKSLGTGTLFASHMQQQADGRHIEAAQAMMLQSNYQAGQLALAHGASACTDVTGFGLLGHLLEMLDDEQGVNLDLAKLPVLSGALESIEAGIFSTMAASNQQALGAVDVAAVGRDHPRLQLLVDPQTSGGLLIAVTPASSGRLCAALCEGGYQEAAEIGEVIPYAPGEGPRVLLRGA